MTAPLHEQFTNGATTTLNGAITPSDATIQVADGSVFPSTGDFHVIIENELILCRGRSTNNLTNCIRGRESTGATSHSTSTTVELVLTKESLDRIGKDNVGSWGYDQPYNILVADDGETLLTTSDFTWVNQGGASVTDQDGSILMRLPTSAGVNLRGQVVSIPSTPYSYIAAFECCFPKAAAADVCFALFGFRHSTDFEMQFIIAGSNGDEAFRLGVQNYNTGTSSNSVVRDLNAFSLINNSVWLKVEDDGTDLSYYASPDGRNWAWFYTEGRTAFMPSGPDQLLWGGVNNSNADNEGLVRLVHWSRET